MMTEMQWFSPRTPISRMLDRVSAQPRKVTMVAVGFCYMILHLMKDTRSREAVKAVEAIIADDLDYKNAKVLARRAVRNSDDAYNKAIRNMQPAIARSAARVAAEIAAIACSHIIESRVMGASYRINLLSISELAALIAQTASRDGMYFKDVQQQQRRLIHCVFGNPFQPTTFMPAWQTHEVIGLAKTLYQARFWDNEHLGLLSDALEEAGCTNKAVLDHLRDWKTPHCRGCWVIDGILGM
jgi:hypothetical protein